VLSTQKLSSRQLITLTQAKNETMKIFTADEAPLPIGPYSHAVRTGDLLFCSGQTPIDPKTMRVEAQDIESQTICVLENLKAVLKEAGLSMFDVVKTNVFLTDMTLFAEMNAVYAAHFDSHKPARSTVAVKALPLDALVEIECIAEFNNRNIL
jgi:2-iminobutanoate/2-iminopropanoate deaminase